MWTLSCLSGPRPCRSNTHLVSAQTPAYAGLLKAAPATKHFPLTGRILSKESQTEAQTKRYVEN